MAVSPINSLTAHIFLRWVLVTIAFTVLVPLLIPIVEFPIMLLVAIVARMFDAPDVPSRIHDVVYSAIYRQEAFLVSLVVIGFFVLHSTLSRAIGKEFGGKVLLLQDAPVPPPQ